MFSYLGVLVHESAFHTASRESSLFRTNAVDANQRFAIESRSSLSTSYKKSKYPRSK